MSGYQDPEEVLILHRELSIPPQGWYMFGWHARSNPVPDLEFSEETDPEDGLPLWERPIN